MADDNQDIFGKIDALLEKRAGFGTREAHRHADDDFPVLTEVVEPQPIIPSAQERRQGERRLNVDRRQLDRRQQATRPLAAPPASLSEDQFNRFLATFEQKLEDLFIRQQLRIEETVRRALQGQGENARRSDPL